MGLDMNPLPRPKAGHETEFEQLWQTLNIAFGKLPDPDAARRPKKGFWATFFTGPDKREPVDTARMVARFEEISEPHWRLLGAPVVGQDAQADAWVREQWAKGALGTTDTDENAALERLSGLRVLDLVPDCDGFPEWQGSSGERCSLRGEVLRECKAVLAEDLIARAWQPMLAKDLAVWSVALFEALGRLQLQSGILPDMRDADLSSVEGQAHAVGCAARWARHWSACGHGSDPDY